MVEVFTFRGHVFDDTNHAKYQRMCPHCGKLHTKMCAIETDDFDFDFLGEKRLNDKVVAQCFKCTDCGEFLWFHRFSDIKLENQKPTKLESPRRRLR